MLQSPKFRLLIAAFVWVGLAQSSSAQGLGVGITIGGVGVGVGVGSPSTPSVSVTTPLGSVNVGGSSSGTGTTAANVSVLSQQAVTDAVTTHKALPLDAILARARAVTTGQIVDAQLISYRGFLLYDLKVLATTGDVSELYFYARSGEQVQTK